jgi:hypothetical protein
MSVIGTSSINIDVKGLQGETSSFRAYILDSDGKRRIIDAEIAQKLSPEIQSFVQNLLESSSREIQAALRSSGQRVQFKSRNISVISDAASAPPSVELTHAVGLDILTKRDTFLRSVKTALYPELAALPSIESIVSPALDSLSSQEPLESPRSAAHSLERSLPSHPTHFDPETESHPTLDLESIFDSTNSLGSDRQNLAEEESYIEFEL